MNRFSFAYIEKNTFFILNSGKMTLFVFTMALVLKPQFEKLIQQILKENKMLPTQAHCPVIGLLETFWTFTSLVVLRHLESIWTLTIVTSLSIDT